MLNSNNSTILAIETATNACCVGLLYQGETFESVKVGNNIHSQVLLSMVDNLLQQQGLSVENLDVVAVDQGPGSFTGLRIGIGVAQGIAFAASCPMVGVSSLDILANEVMTTNQQFKLSQPVNIIAGLDARMSEIYWCSYLLIDDELQALSEHQITKPDDMRLDQQYKWIAVGNAWSVYDAQLSKGFVGCIDVQLNCEIPTANALLDLAHKKVRQGLTVEAIEFVPDYVRNDVAKKKGADKKKDS